MVIVPETRPAPSTRPSNRRAQILEAAAGLFHSRGYTRVSLDEIASAVSISAPALYRHFPGKQALLAAVVDDNLTALEQLVAAVGSIDELADSLATFTMARDDIGVILTREMECLEGEARDRSQERLDIACSDISAIIASSHDRYSPAESELAAMMVFAVTCSASYNPSAAGTEALGDLIARLVRVICGHLPMDAVMITPVPSRVLGLVLPQPWLSRSEAIIAATPSLLVQRGGYDMTTLDDLGNAAGIAGSGVYNYFASKTDVFFTASVRGLEWGASDLEKALAMSTSGVDVLRRALDSQLALAMWPMKVVLDVGQLPLSLEQSGTIERLTTRYMSLWLECLRAARPDLSLMQQGIALTAGISVVAELSGRRNAANMQVANDDITRFVLAILLES